MKFFIKSYLWIPSLISFVLYFPVISFNTAWGDDSFVTQPLTRDLKLTFDTFLHTVPGSHFFPFSFLQCFVINSLFSYPFGFHLYAVILHTISNLLATLIFYKLTKNKTLSILLVIIWAVHPINVETITRLVCAPAHVPAGLFCLAFLYCFLKLLKANNLTAKILLSSLGIFFFLASITSCEQYILFPLVLVFIFLLKKDEIALQKKDCFYFLALPILIIYVLYIIWRYMACGGSLFYAGDEFITWCEIGSLKDMLFRAFWLAPQLLVQYLRLFFWPDYLAESKADWYMVGDRVWSFYSLFCQFLTLFIITISIYLWKKLPLFSIGICWFYLTMLPVIQIIPLFSIVDEHYSYLPTLGILLSILSLLDYIFKEKLSFKALIILISICFGFAWRTWLYLPSGKNELIQAIHMANHSNEWTRPLHMLNAYKLAAETGRVNELPSWINEENATKEVFNWIRKYLNITPNLSHKFGPIQMPYNFDVYYGLSFFFFHNHMFKELDVLIKQATEVKNDSFGWYKISTFFRGVKEWGPAWRYLKQAIILNPKLNLLYDYSFVEIAKNANKYDEAEKFVKTHIKLKQKYSYPYLFAGLFYQAFNKQEEAIEYLKIAVSNQKIPNINSKEMYKEAYEIFLQNKMLPEAIQTLKIILSFDPFDEEAKQKLSGF